MKTLLAPLITAALLAPATVSANHCPSKGYHKHKGQHHHGMYHPHAYHRGHEGYGKWKMKKHGHAYHPHGKPMMKKHHHGEYGYGKSYGYAYPSNTPYQHGGNMYLHLPKSNQNDSVKQAPVESNTAPAASDPAPVELSDILTTAAGAGQFNTLVEAVKAAGLEETLTGPGPFTVFAPTDEAFSRLPESILKALTENTQALTDLLTTHVVAGKVTAADVVGLDNAKSVQGSQLTITHGDGVAINGAKVVTTDIEASNGIIHIVDSVIFPQS